MSGSKLNEGEILLTNVRIAFAQHLFKPNPEDDTPKYKCRFLIPKDREDLEKKIRDQIQKVARAKWSSKPKKLELCLRDGDDQTHEGHADHWYVNASEKERPTIIDVDRSPLVEEDGRPYGGCFVNAIVSFWAQDNKHGTKVNCNLKAVQFWKHGESFSMAPPVDTNAFPVGDIENDWEDAPESAKKPEGDDWAGEAANAGSDSEAWDEPSTESWDDAGDSSEAWD